MRMPRFLLGFVSLMLAAPIIVAREVERAVDFLLGLLPVLVSEPRLAIDGPAMEFETNGTAGDPALLNSLRHEAGMRRLR